MFSKRMIFNIENAVGMKISTVMSYSPEKMIKYAENKNKKKLEYDSIFPLNEHGGSVIRDYTNSQKINNEVDVILGLR